MAVPPAPLPAAPVLPEAPVPAAPVAPAAPLVPAAPDPVPPLPGAHASADTNSKGKILRMTKADAREAMGSICPDDRARVG